MKKAPPARLDLDALDEVLARYETADPDWCPRLTGETLGVMQALSAEVRRLRSQVAYCNAACRDAGVSTEHCDLEGGCLR